MSMVERHKRRANGLIERADAGPATADELGGVADGDERVPQPVVQRRGGLRAIRLLVENRRAADHAAAVGSAATASATVAANPLTSVASLSVRGRFALTVSTAASSVSRRTGTSITYAR